MRRKKRPREENRRDRCYSFSVECISVLEGYVWASSLNKAKQAVREGKVEDPKHTLDRVKIGKHAYFTRCEDREQLPTWLWRHFLAKSCYECGESILKMPMDSFVFEPDDESGTWCNCSCGHTFQLETRYDVRPIVEAKQKEKANEII